MAIENDHRLQINEDEQIRWIAIEEIMPNPYQPRKNFDAERLNDLAESIKIHGILQPIVLRQTVQGYYIVVGERRYRASQLAGLTKLPSIIKELSDADMMELAIIENLQREDLNAIEEAESYQRLMDDLQLTQQEVAHRLGKSRPYIANMLRLLHLPTSLKDSVQRGELSGAHGRTLLGIKDKQRMIQVGRKAFKESWSVRYLEKYVNNIQEGSQPYPKVTKEPLKPKFIQKQERLLREQYGAKVDISTKKQVGAITFEFKSKEEFERLIKLLHDK
ncbi:MULTISPECIES: ParB/RepB/Spo0J family partition protein [Staphylococcus]|uniref:ParB/RepB/Spo0J family partition protein n=1 Tax=Staphylococcus lugdunensis TaxID=28035 RepID=A0ABX6BSX6_STALU|nr:MULTISPECIES: ParB/RepB/Spo0J family partition protein [Staphylococcus]MDU5818126.1 ParB/RepB/Spo0J family partition protein [Staphylococcus sp.]ADC88563.1 Chromosome (plasmid) partitioning protein ParB [Staphylococcus lugdunensis HKU09-01]AMG64462.1 chromosome partitioning protein ParB [Staphylococcus lugdunensis]ARJ07869.1 chromosome partitioning protein ParB [Staphylococcus lugdunensis]ARJ17287.1 chromosome partitioning protein ParB [Staphylococcus lugdunensis]